MSVGRFFLPGKKRLPVARTSYSTMSTKRESAKTFNPCLVGPVFAWGEEDSSIGRVP